jgi:hypothetical protein
MANRIRDPPLGWSQHIGMTGPPARHFRILVETMREFPSPLKRPMDREDGGHAG